MDDAIAQLEIAEELGEEVDPELSSALLVLDGEIAELLAQSSDDVDIDLEFVEMNDEEKKMAMKAMKSGSVEVIVFRNKVGKTQSASVITAKRKNIDVIVDELPQTISIDDVSKTSFDADVFVEAEAEAEAAPEPEVKDDVVEGENFDFVNEELAGTFNAAELDYIANGDEEFRSQLGASKLSKSPYPLVLRNPEHRIHILNKMRETKEIKVGPLAGLLGVMDDSNNNDSYRVKKAASKKTTTRGKKAQEAPAPTKVQNEFAIILDADYNAQTGTVSVEVESKKTKKKQLVTGEPDGRRSSKVNWVFSEPDPTTAGGYSGSIPLGVDESRNLAIKVLGKAFVESYEAAVARNIAGDLEGADRDIAALVAGIKSVTTESKEEVEDDLGSLLLQLQNLEDSKVAYTGARKNEKSFSEFRAMMERAANSGNSKFFLSRKTEYGDAINAIEARREDLLNRIQALAAEGDTVPDYEATRLLDQLNEYESTFNARVAERAKKKEATPSISKEDFSVEEKWTEFRDDQEREVFELLVEEGYPITDLAPYLGRESKGHPAEPMKYLKGKRLYLNQRIKELYPTVGITEESLATANRSDSVKWRDPATDKSVGAPIIVDEKGKPVFTNDPAITKAQIRVFGTVKVPKGFKGKNKSIEVNKKGFVVDVAAPENADANRKTRSQTANLESLNKRAQLASVFRVSFDTADEVTLPDYILRQIDRGATDSDAFYNRAFVKLRNIAGKRVSSERLSEFGVKRNEFTQAEGDSAMEALGAYYSATRLYVIADRIANAVSKAIDFPTKIQGKPYTVYETDPNSFEPTYMADNEVDQELVSGSRAKIADIIRDMTDEQVISEYISPKLMKRLIGDNNITEVADKIKQAFPHLDKDLTARRENRAEALLVRFGAFMLRKSVGLKVANENTTGSTYSDFSVPPRIETIYEDIRSRNVAAFYQNKQQLATQSLQAMQERGGKSGGGLDVADKMAYAQLQLEMMSFQTGAFNAEAVEDALSSTRRALSSAMDNSASLKSEVIKLVKSLREDLSLEGATSTTILDALFVIIENNADNKVSVGRDVLIRKEIKNLSESKQGRTLASYLYYLGWVPQRIGNEGQTPSVSSAIEKAKGLVTVKGILTPPRSVSIAEPMSLPQQLEADYENTLLKIVMSPEGARVRAAVARANERADNLDRASRYVSYLQNVADNPSNAQQYAKLEFDELGKQIILTDQEIYVVSTSIKRLENLLNIYENASRNNDTKTLTKLSKGNFDPSTARVSIGVATERLNQLGKKLDSLRAVRNDPSFNDFTKIKDKLSRAKEGLSRLQSTEDRNMSLRGVVSYLASGVTLTEPSEPTPQPTQKAQPVSLNKWEKEYSPEKLQNALTNMRVKLSELAEARTLVIRSKDAREPAIKEERTNAKKELDDAQIDFNNAVSEAQESGAPAAMTTEDRKQLTKLNRDLNRLTGQLEKESRSMVTTTKPDDNLTQLSNELASSYETDMSQAVKLVEEKVGRLDALKGKKEQIIRAQAQIAVDLSKTKQELPVIQKKIEKTDIELGRVEFSKKEAVNRKAKLKGQKASEEEIAKLDKSIVSRDSRIAKLTGEISEYKKEEKKVQGSITRLTSKLKKLDTDLTDLNGKIAMFAIQDAPKSKETIQLEDKVTKLGQRLAQLDSQIATTKKEIELVEFNARARAASQDVRVPQEVKDRLEKAKDRFEAADKAATDLATSLSSIEDEQARYRTAINLIEVSLGRRVPAPTGIRASLSDTAIRLRSERIRVNTAEFSKIGLDKGTETALRNIAASGAPHLRVMAEILLSNKDLLSNVQVAVVEIDPQVAGLYVSDRLVMINMAGHNGRGLADVLIHELTHALTVSALRNPEAAKRINSLRVLAQRKLRDAGFDVDSVFYRHAFSDNAEFLSAVFTDQHIQNALRSTEVEGGRSWIARMWDIVLGALGIKNNNVVTALDEVISFANMASTTYGSHAAITRQRAEAIAAENDYHAARLNLDQQTLELLNQMTGGDLSGVRASNNKPLTEAEYARHADLESRKDSLTPDELTEAEALVEKAAQGAGFDTEAWHYTSSPEQFTEFDSSMAGDFGGWFYFSPKNVNRSGRSSSRLAGKFFLNLGNTLTKPSYETVAGVGTPNSYITEADTNGYDSITGTEQGLSGVEVAEYVTKSPAQIKSAEPFTGVPLRDRFNTMSNDIRFSLSEEPATLESRIRSMVPAGYTLTADPNLRGAFAVKGNSMSYNPAMVERSISDALPEVQDMILSTMISHEMAHTAADAVMTPADYDSVAAELGEDILSEIADNYYSSQYPDAEVRAAKIKEDRDSGILSDREIAAEWFRSKVEKAVYGKSTEEVFNELSHDDSLISRFAKYLEKFISFLTGRQKEVFSIKVAADISRASRVLELLMNDGVPLANPDAQEEVGHAAEFLEALRTGNGNQTHFVLELKKAGKQGTSMSSVWSLMKKAVRNLPSDVFDTVKERDGALEKAKFGMERFAPHYRRQVEQALKNGADINDVGLILGTTAPTMDNAAIGRVKTALRAFRRTFPKGTKDIDDIVKAESDRLFAAEKIVQDSAFLKRQMDAIARMDAQAPELSKFLQEFRKKINEHQNEIGYSDSAGIYLTRTFKFFNTQGWAAAARNAEGKTYRLGSEVIDFGDLRAKAAKSYEEDVREEYKKENKPLTAEILSREVYLKLDNFLEWLSENATEDKGESLSQDLRRRMPKRNVDTDVRALLGEVTNPVENALRTFHYVAVLDANKQALTKIKDQLLDNGMGSETPRTGYVKIFKDALNTKAPLAGLYVREDIAKELEAEFGANGRNLLRTSDAMVEHMGSTISKISGIAMTAKTLPSVGFQIRNIITNLAVMPASQGVIPLLSPQMRTLHSFKLAHLANFPSTRANASLETIAEVEKLIKLNVLRDSQNRKLFEDLMRGYADRAGVTFDTALNDILGMAQRQDYSGLLDFSKKAGKMLGKPIEFLAAINALFDDMSKAQMYFYERYELERAYPEKDSEWHDKEAATKVKLTMPTHSYQLDVIRSFNRHPLALLAFPFARWKTEMLRTMVNTVKLSAREMASGNPRMIVRGLRRGAGFGLVTAVGLKAASYVLAAAFRKLTGEDEEEDAKTKQVEDPAVLAALRLGFPEYQESHSLYVTTNGRELSVIDMTSIHPNAIVNDLHTIVKESAATGKGVDVKRLASYFTNQFIGSQIAAKAVIDITNNKNDFGQNIYEETDDAFTATQKMFAHVYRQAYEPGVIAKIRSSTRTGEQNPDYIWAGEFLGARPKVYTLDQVARTGFYKLKASSDSIKRQRSVLSGGRALDADRVREVMTETQDAENLIQARTHALIKALQSVGTDDRVITQRAVSTGMSKKRVAEAFAGVNTTWFGSNDWFENMNNNVTNVGEDDPRSRYEIMKGVVESMPRSVNVSNIE